MNKSKLVLGLVFSGIAVTSSFAQKNVVTDAAVEFKNVFYPAVMSGKTDEAKKSLISAKESIDKAAANSETAKDPRMLFYKGEIYGSAAFLMQKQEDTTFVFQTFGRDFLQVSVDAYRESYKTSKKYQGDIDQSIGMKIGMIEPLANKAFDEKRYEEAAQAFYGVFKLLQAKNVDELGYLSNAAISYSNAGKYTETAEAYTELARLSKPTEAGEKFALAGDAYTRAKQYDKALEILNEGKAKLGMNKEILLETVRVNLAQGNNVEAEKSLTDAIAADPSNKQLHYVIGTIYTDLKDYDKSEKAFNAALAIDPNYKDALYNLGAMLVTQAQELNKEASMMNLNDWRYDVTIDKAEQSFKRAIQPLEKYLASEPKNANVLMVLFQLNQNIGETEKAMEYKKRFDETQK